MKMTVESLSWQTEGSQTGQEERRKTGLDYIYLVHTEIRGTQWRSSLTQCVINREVMGSIPGGVIFIDIILPDALRP
jgi:hypothetical protein